jgi:hypothetical protein
MKFSLSLVSLFAVLVLPSTLAAPVPADRVASLKHASFGHPIALSGLPSGFVDLKQRRGLTTAIQLIKKRCPESVSGDAEVSPEVINNVSTPSTSKPDATVEEPAVEAPDVPSAPAPSADAPAKAESIPDVISSLNAELKPITEQLSKCSVLSFNYKTGLT